MWLNMTTELNTNNVTAAAKITEETHCFHLSQSLRLSFKSMTLFAHNIHYYDRYYERYTLFIMINLINT